MGRSKDGRSRGRAVAPLLLPLAVTGALALSLSLSTGPAFLLALERPAAASAGALRIRGRQAGRQLLVARAARSAEDVFREGLALLNYGKAPPDQLAQAVRLIHQAAEEDVAEAQVTVGGMYAQGFAGVPRDMPTAIDWFRKAAEVRHPKANFNLGVLHLTGDGVPQDKKMAARYFKNAADAGHAIAMMNLAQMFVKGDGVPKDMQIAAQWLVRAAKSSGELEELMKRIQSSTLDPETSMRLGEMVEKLRDVQRDNPAFMKTDAKTEYFDIGEAP